jgi:hypothetical protein
MASQPAPTDENRLADENGTTMASMLPKKAIDFLNNEVSKRFKLNTGKPTLQGVVTFEIDDPVAQDNAPLEAFLVHNSKVILVSPVEQFPRSVASIRCPSCGNSKSVKIDGWTNNLRSVKDVHCEHLLKQRKYKCTQCAGEMPLSSRLRWKQLQFFAAFAALLPHRHHSHAKSCSLINCRRQQRKQDHVFQRHQCRGVEAAASPRAGKISRIHFCQGRSDSPFSASHACGCHARQVVQGHRRRF